MALNLKNLEKKLNLSLERENTKDLLKWLLNKRKMCLTANLGEGEFDILISNKAFFSIPQSKNITFNIKSKTNCSKDANWSEAA